MQENQGFSELWIDKPEYAKVMYLRFNHLLREKGISVEEGIFGADMKVKLINDGPVTIWLDSKEV